MTTFKLWIDATIVSTFIAVFESHAENTPFKGASLVKTGQTIEYPKDHVLFGEIARDVEVELKADKMTYLEIPGHTFLGMIEFEGEEKFVRTFKDFDWLSILPEISANRCDVCKVKHNRRKVFVLQEDETGKIIVVGGACSKKFKDINLDSMLYNILKSFDKIIEGCWGDKRIKNSADLPDLALEIAVGEFLIEETSYISRNQADMSNNKLVSTADQIMEVVRKAGSSFDKETWVKIYKRRTELLTTEFAEHKEYFTKKFEETKSEFAHNCLSTLKSASTRRMGLTAWIANVKNLKASEKLTPAVTKPVDAPLNKMVTLGKFKIVNIKTSDDYYGTYYNVCAVNENNEKIWFKTNFSSKAGEILDDAEVGNTIEVRCKVSAHKDNISFVKNVKILSIV